VSLRVVVDAREARVAARVRASVPPRLLLDGAAGGAADHRAARGQHAGHLALHGSRTWC
jgi:hypothetical protein